MYKYRDLNPKYENKLAQYKLESIPATVYRDKDGQKMVIDRIVTYDHAFYISDLITGSIYHCYLSAGKRHLTYTMSQDIEKSGVDITSLDFVTKNHIYLFNQTRSGLKLQRYNKYSSIVTSSLNFNDTRITQLHITNIINAFVNSNDHLYIVTNDKVYCYDLKTDQVIHGLLLHTIVDAGIDFLCNEIHVVHHRGQGSTFVTIYDDKLQKLRDIEYCGTAFVVNNNIVYGVSGNKITVYHIHDTDYKLKVLESHIMEDYPPDIECVFAVTSSTYGLRDSKFDLEQLLVAGYDQDNFYLLHNKYFR